MNTISPQQGNIPPCRKLKYSSNRNHSHNHNNSSNPSFKGGADTIITAVKDKELMNVFSQHYGNIGERIGEKLYKLTNESEILRKSSRFAMKDGALSITDKKVGRSLLENVIFPFVNLPLYGASAVVKKAKGIPALEEGAKKLYDKPILRIPRKLNELDSKTDMLKGMFEKTKQTVTDFAREKGMSPDEMLHLLGGAEAHPESQKLVGEANEYIKENLYKVSNKFFDKHTGNFNTAYERPLNRIITGLIPVAFLANDAYNLSVLCGDKKEDSTKEAKAREKQEIIRIFTTAYIQLLTFGAFTKQVNTIPWFAPVTSAATVLVSEIFSRKKLGKPVFFLSKDMAQEYNQRNAENADKPKKKGIFGKKHDKKQVEAANKTENAVKPENTVSKAEKTDNASKPVSDTIKYMDMAAPESEVFKGFNTVAPAIAAASFTAANKNENANKADDTNKAENTNKKAAKHNKSNKAAKAKDNKKEEPKKALINFETFKKGVIILTSTFFALSFLKNSSLTKNTKLVKGLTNFGKTMKKKLYDPLAFKDFEMTPEKFDSVMGSLKEAGCEKVAEGHEFIKGKYAKQTKDGVFKLYKATLGSDKVGDVVNAAITEAVNANSALTATETETIGKAIQTAVRLGSADIAENKFGNVAKKAMEIIKNKKVNLTEEQAETVRQAITDAINQHAKEVPIQIDTKLKPFVDIVTEPFKFIHSAAKLPFKIVKSGISMMVSPIEKKAAKEALGKAELSKFEQGVHRVVTEIFGEKQGKTDKISQVIFANAMEQLEKKTLPYRQAEQAWQQAVKSGKGADEVARLKKAVDAAKQKLMVYVNTAVEKSFNGVTQSSNKNTDLALMSKLASSTVTSAFLVADNYNMVMLKSNGEDKEGAKEKANERIIQRLSGLFYQALFINWFNATFRSTYNSSLRGMTSVTIPNTLTTEILTRKSIGMPIGRKSLDELNAIDEKNENRTGIAGKYFKFMRLLTGKKPLKDRLPKEKRNEMENKNEKANLNLNKMAEISSTKSYSTTARSDNSSTNVLEMLSKK